jgi:hypothetical protein
MTIQVKLIFAVRVLGTFLTESAHLVAFGMSAPPPLMEAKRTCSPHFRNDTFDPNVICLDLRAIEPLQTSFDFLKA